MAANLSLLYHITTFYPIMHIDFYWSVYESDKLSPHNIFENTMSVTPISLNTITLLYAVRFDTYSLHVYPIYFFYIKPPKEVENCIATVSR